MGFWADIVSFIGILSFIVGAIVGLALFLGQQQQRIDSINEQRCADFCAPSTYYYAPGTTYREELCQCRTVTLEP